MTESYAVLDGVRVPRFLYGTAWKEGETRRLTELALNEGFRGIDTANQRKHYFEAAVGEGIQSAIGKGIVRRDELFLQTKFTFRAGQDHRLPYDPHAPVAVQVEQSFGSSQQHLGTDTIDSYVLHGPSQRMGLGAADWEAWGAMEEIQQSGRARLLGVSNVSLSQLQELCDKSQVPPRFVQNRCYASRGWDRPVREFCRTHEIQYQGFSLLTANRDVLTGPELVGLAKCHQRSASQIVFRFALEIGILPLTGTTNPSHMRADLEIFDFRLSPEEVAAIESLLTD